jgi:hypothetical protein
MHATPRWVQQTHHAGAGVFRGMTIRRFHRGPTVLVQYRISVFKPLGVPGFLWRASPWNPTTLQRGGAHHGDLRVYILACVPHLIVQFLRATDVVRLPSVRTPLLAAASSQQAWSYILVLVLFADRVYHTEGCAYHLRDSTLK